jgi:hypothetical protein
LSAVPAKQIEKIAKGSVSLDDQFPAHFVRVGPDRTTVRKQVASLRQLLGFQEGKSVFGALRVKYILTALASFNMPSLPFKPGTAAIKFEY